MIIFFLLTTSSAQTCPTISCGELSYPTCSKSNSTHFRISTCLPNESCDYSKLKGTQKCHLSPGTRYSGDFCSNDSECISGNCKSNTCYSNNYQEPCSDTGDCNVGLYCDGSVCQNQLKAGSSCSNDTECSNNLMCNKGVCIEYWSRLSTDEVEPPVNGLSLACRTAGAVQGPSGVWHCGQSDNSTVLGERCEVGDYCFSFNNFYTLNCTCGSTDNGDAFCGLFPGDEPVQEAIRDAQEVFSVNSFCNTHSRFSLYCFLAHQQYLSMFLKFAKNFHLAFGGFYVRTLEASDCVNQALNREYFEITQAIAAEDHSCPAFYCPQDRVNDNQCSVVVNDSNFGQFVEIHYSYPVCDWDYNCSSSGQCVAQNISLGHPGDFCNETYLCASGHCIDHFCLGIREGEVCKHPGDCMPGFYCNMNSSICERLKLKSELCDSNYECSNYLICNLGTCINYFSLELKENTDICEVDEYGTCLYSYACASGFATASLTPGEFVCATAPISQPTNPCNYSGQVCYDNSNKYSHICTCSYQEVLNGIDTPVYCPPFAGDIHYQNAIANLRRLLNWNQVCNARSRLSPRCFLRSDEYLGYYYFFVTNLTYFRNYTKIYGVSDCIKKVFMHQEYLNEQYLLEWVKKHDNNNNDHDESFSKYWVTGLIFIVVSLS